MQYFCSEVKAPKAERTFMNVFSTYAYRVMWQASITARQRDKDMFITMVYCKQQALGHLG